MNDLETAKQVVADLEAKRTAFAREGVALGVELAKLAYVAFTDGAETARRRLEQVQASVTANNLQQEAIGAALNEARGLAAEARRLAGLADGKARVARVHEILAALETLAPRLDEGTGSVVASKSAMPTPDAERFRYRSDPPLQVETGKLVTALLVELHIILGRTDVTFPNWGWHLCNRNDLKDQLTLTIARYQRDSFGLRQRDTFVTLITGWAQRIRSDLTQRFGQINQEAA
jgi:hypothetical protein